MPSVAIAAANAEVRLLMAEVEAGQSPAHRQVYNNYTPEQRSTIGKYAAEYGFRSRHLYIRGGARGN